MNADLIRKDNIRKERIIECGFESLQSSADKYGPIAELVYAAVSETVVERRLGSSPSGAIRYFQVSLRIGCG